MKHAVVLAPAPAPVLRPCVEAPVTPAHTGPTPIKVSRSLVTAAGPETTS